MGKLAWKLTDFINRDGSVKIRRSSRENRRTRKRVRLKLRTHGNIYRDGKVRGTVYRLKGSILSISFLDSTGTFLSSHFDSWKSENKACNDKEKKKLSLNNHSKSKISPTSDSHDCQQVLMCSEKQAIVVIVPSQSCVQKINLTEASFVVKAEVILLKDHEKICLSCYTASGNITIYSLPSLKIICNEDFLPLVDMRIARTFCFSKNGHGVYLCSPTELQKFSISADYWAVKLVKTSATPCSLNGPYPVKHGVKLSLDDRNKQLIPCCFKSMPHFINSISWRGVAGQSLSNQRPFVFTG
ncbi:syntaxin-binding protein 5 [Trichonephila clavipes]|uniref:Syntaxin-binding protein 5 n=1 Tax=Trichonephila clavipes TaxID=2585209 RepID=A0A8X6SB75_TRICX|nr:syntaxin-binding protein 5 [Trichonephila clavipes]